MKPKLEKIIMSADADKIKETSTMEVAMIMILEAIFLRQSVL